MLPPGSRAPALWQTVQIVTRPKAYMREQHARYGDAMRFHTLLGKGLAVFEASLAREVFAAPPETFEVADVVGAIFGPAAVIATSGAQHKRQRKLLNPPFHGARIKALFGTMQGVVRKHLEALGAGGQVTMTDLTQAMTLDVILETIFGSSTSARLERGRAILLDIVKAFSPALITGSLVHTELFPPWRRYKHARAELGAWVDALSQERRQSGDLGSDLLGLFLATKYEDGEPMSDAEIRAHLITLLLAGHETSAIAIAWAVYWLLREPVVLRRLRDEVEALASPSAEALTKLPYLSAVVSESLRIEPIVTDVVRLCREPFTLREWTVPKGHLVAVMLGGILADPRIYPEPERFRPERFLDRTYHAGEFLPFGGGQRRCLGAAFAEAELAIAVATIATEWNLELADSRPERAVRRNITMGPARGVRVNVIGRRARPDDATLAATG